MLSHSAADDGKIRMGVVASARYQCRAIYQMWTLSQGTRKRLAHGRWGVVWWVVEDAEAGRSRIIAFVSSGCVSVNVKKVYCQAAKSEKRAKRSGGLIYVKSCHLARYHYICAATGPFDDWQGAMCT